MEEKILHKDDYIKIRIMPEDFEAQEIYVFHSDNTYLIPRGILKEWYEKSPDGLAKMIYNFNQDIIPDILSSSETSNLKDFIITPLKKAYESLLEEQEKSIKAIKQDL